MKRHLLPKLNRYKANLHCHSTLSDGKLTPEELKKAYKEAGYSIIAYSDHNVLVPHTELKDGNFLPITSTEIDITDTRDNWYASKTYHLNFFSRVENRTEFIPVSRVYDVNVINDLIKRGNEAGFLSMYNHSRWSLQTARDYLPLEGLSMYEIYNTGCDTDKMDGYSDFGFEEMLLSGKYLFPTATDDNHNARKDFTSPYNDSFGSFTMLCMDRLEYKTAIEALEKGDFYASTGPEIHEFSIENDTLHIECSPCKVVTVRTDSRVAYTLRSHNGDITGWDIKLNPNFIHKFIRLEVYDEYRNRAFTRAYTREEIV